MQTVPLRSAAGKAKYKPLATSYSVAPSEVPILML